MSRYNSKPQYNHGDNDAVGVLMVNLGTPEKPTTNSVRTYLREFLSDPRVIEIPKILWLIILYLFILPLRPSKSAEAYKKIWTKKGSPLLFNSLDIAKKTKLNLNKGNNKNIHVELAMSYGSPSINEVLNGFHEKSIRQVLLLPLYPQYSSTTTGSVFEAVSKSLTMRRWIPEFRFINHYHDLPMYIEAVAASIESYWEVNGRGEKLLFSFHGLPQKMLMDGDPYHCQCQKTGRLIAEKLSLKDEEWFISFQSRLGRAKWLEPYTDETLINWGKEKKGTIDVVCPGFAADCLETLEEIAMQNNEFYVEAGGESLRYIPALNSQQSHISFLSELINENISDWLKNDALKNSDIHDGELQQSCQRAAQKGAKNLLGINQSDS
jgi:ferrochelatase